ncbi:MAG TPA: hypothetical protein VF480_12505, partial [Verrucomicrobiae bacterium]
LINWADVKSMAFNCVMLGGLRCGKARFLCGFFSRKTCFRLPTSFFGIITKPRPERCCHIGKIDAFVLPIAKAEQNTIGFYLYDGEIALNFAAIVRESEGVRLG